MAVATTSVRAVGAATRCEIAQSAKAHIIGWRVTRKTPCGSARAASFAPGIGSEGLRGVSEPTSRTIASQVSSAAKAQETSPKPGQSGVPTDAPSKA